MSSRILKTSFLTAALLLAAVAFAGRAGTSQDVQRAARQPSSAPSPVVDEHPFDPLDRVVQQRFHDVVGFGMARIATERKFAPETKEEKEAVKNLKRAGYEVGLYLAGRGILASVPVKFRRSKTHFGALREHTMSGPVFVSSAKTKGLPGGPELWEPTREALLAFGGGAERSAFKVGGWEVEARPVRATNESCLRCHTDVEFKVFQYAEGTAYGWERKEGSVLRVGDPLGVLLYVYKKRSR